MQLKACASFLFQSFYLCSEQLQFLPAEISLNK